MRRINLFLIRNQGDMIKKLAQNMQHALENSLINLKNIYNLHKKRTIVHKLQTADFRIKLSLLHLEQFWVLLKMQSNYTQNACFEAVQNLEDLPHTLLREY